MKRKLFLSFYSLVITIFIILSTLGKFLHSPGKITISAGFALLLLFLFLSYNLLKYDFRISIFLWLPLFLILSNLSVQLTGGLSQSVFSPLYLFLVIIVALKSERSGIVITLILILILESMSALLNKRMNLHFSMIMVTLISLSFFLSYFIGNLKMRKKEVEKKLNDIEKTTSALSTPTRTSDRNELLKTFKNKKDGFDLKAKEKMGELIEPILSVLSHTIDSHSSVVFLKEENTKSFFFFLKKSHSAYINTDAVISQKTGIYTWVIKEKKPLLDSQLFLNSTLLEYYLRDESIRSIIIIPLLEDEELIGLLICDSKEENKFDSEDKEKLKVFGNLIVSTITLFKSLKQAQWDASRYFILREFAEKLSQSRLEKDSVLDIFTKIAPQGFDFDLLVLILCEEKEKPIIYKTFPEDEFAYLKDFEVSIGSSLAGLAIKNNQILIKPKKIKTPFFSKSEKGLEHFQSFFGVPLHKEEKVSGELVLMSKNPSHFSQEKKEPIIFLANLITEALDKAELYQETKALSIKDGLTGAFNHRHFQESLTNELQRAKRIGSHFSLLMLDIDHFKGFNDNFGHQIGDRVLKHISDIVMKNIREVDIFARYGGEEFIIILPDTKRDGAMAVGEKIRMLIEKKPLIIRNNPYPVTVSIGCSVFPSDGEDKNRLINKVDKALYRAKQDGRNCVR